MCDGRAKFAAAALSISLLFLSKILTTGSDFKQNSHVDETCQKTISGH